MSANCEEMGRYAAAQHGLFISRIENAKSAKEWRRMRLEFDKLLGEEDPLLKVYFERCLYGLFPLARG